MRVGGEGKVRLEKRGEAGEEEGKNESKWVVLTDFSKQIFLWISVVGKANRKKNSPFEIAKLQNNFKTEMPLWWLLITSKKNGHL